MQLSSNDINTIWYVNFLMTTLHLPTTRDKLMLLLAVTRGYL